MSFFPAIFTGGFVAVVAFGFLSGQGVQDEAAAILAFVAGVILFLMVYRFGGGGRYTYAPPSGGTDNGVYIPPEPEPDMSEKVAIPRPAYHKSAPAPAHQPAQLPGRKQPALPDYTPQRVPDEWVRVGGVEVKQPERKGR